MWHASGGRGGAGEDESEGGREERIHDLINKQEEKKKEENRALRQTSKGSWCILGEDIFNSAT